MVIFERNMMDFVLKVMIDGHKTGDVISLELNCDSGTLGTSLNGRDLGLLVEALPPNAELVWYAECFFGGDSVAIVRRDAEGV